MERRLPIIVVVRLARPESTNLDSEERTFTDNISSHGARIFSRQPWQPGEAVHVTPVHQASACGRVIYCQKLHDNRYSIGLHFPDHPVNWSTLQSYTGMLA